MGLSVLDKTDEYTHSSWANKYCEYSWQLVVENTVSGWFNYIYIGKQKTPPHFLTAHLKPIYHLLFLVWTRWPNSYFIDGTLQCTQKNRHENNMRMILHDFEIV